MTRFYLHLVIGFIVLWILSGLTCGGCATPPRSIPTPNASLSGSTDAGTEAETATDSGSESLSGSDSDAATRDADDCAALACGVVDGKLACVEITCAEAEALEVKRAADELGEMGMNRF